MADTDRIFVKVDVDYSLRGPDGFCTPDTHAVTWFFELPAAKNTQEGWTELLHRIFYDNNVRLRRREPNDMNWLHVERFRVVPVDIATMLASDGNSWDVMPWFAAYGKIVWEVAVCYFINEQGLYDTLNPSDFTELILTRQFNAGTIDADTAIRFYDHLYAMVGKPPGGKAMFQDHEARLANLVAVRPAGYYQKPPDEKPWTSGPVDVALIQP